MREILEQLRDGRISLEEAEERLKSDLYENLGYARIDHDRKERVGRAEVVFCQGKPDEYLTGIYRSIYERNGEVLGTRASAEQARIIRECFPQVVYNPISRILKIEKEKTKTGCVAVCSGGTADAGVAEEAAETAEFFGSRVERIFDVGVAGIHRLLSQAGRLEKARAVVAVAGMEGALASVVAGLVKVPVIAVPTSVGYGASFGGISALLGMLNSCSSGVCVVNIDNGYGAGYVADQINRA